MKHAVRVIERFVAFSQELLNWLRSCANGRRKTQVQIAIGENHRFELGEALLV